jgi:hypothetical protein
LSVPIFHCGDCNQRTEPTTEDFIRSGIWPGSPGCFSILFRSDLLEYWHHVRFLTPGTSEQNFLKSLSAISVSHGRKSTIDKKMFGEASKAYDYVNHLIDKKIKNVDKKKCRACIDCETGKPQCLACHIDGNFKLLKHLIVNEYDAIILMLYFVIKLCFMAISG